MMHQTFLRGDKDHDLTIGDCEYAVRHPGKYELCARFVPLFWDRIAAWGDPPDHEESLVAFDSYCQITGVDPESEDMESAWIDGEFDIYSYDVTLEDCIDFPELATVQTVYMWESDSGFVHYDTKESRVPIYVYCGI